MISIHDGIGLFLKEGNDVAYCLICLVSAPRGVPLNLRGGLPKENGFHYQQFWSWPKIKGHGKKKSEKSVFFGHWGTLIFKLDP